MFVQKKSLLKFCTTLAIFFLMTISCSAKKLKTTNIVIEKADGSTVTVKAEVAKTSEERDKGFMNRKNIPEGTGMIFVFEKDEILSFWMKDTPTALSIAFIDKNGKIRDILDMTPFSLSTVSSTTSVRYALEVPKGWFSKNGICVGDKLTSLDF